MNIRLTSLFVSLFLSVPVWAGGHKNLPAKGDLHIPVFENVNVRFSPDTYLIIIMKQMVRAYTIWSTDVSF